MIILMIIIRHVLKMIIILPHILETPISRVEISFICSSGNLAHDNVPVQFYRHPCSLKRASLVKLSTNNWEKIALT